MSKQRLSKDTWTRIIGIPLIGVGVPLFFFPVGASTAMWVSIVSSLTITAFAWLVTPFALNRVSQVFPWQTRPMGHVLAELAVLLTVGSTMCFMMTLPILYAQGFSGLLPTNTGVMYLVIFLVLFLITALYEIGTLFLHWKNSLLEKERLEKANALSQYEALKNQVNPHFLFNSLSTLSSLVYPEPQPEKAKRYLDEFAHIYRYILDINQEAVVSVSQELEFLHSYLYLLQIRYAGQLQVAQDIAPDTLKHFLPPLSLQVLLENITKHNQIDSQHPMQVSIKAQDGWLTVSNNLHARTAPPSRNSTRIGLTNLQKQYELISEKKPEFSRKQNYFTARLPLIIE